MKFYPSNDLYRYYRRYARNAWLSPRIQDHTIAHTLNNLNRAINCCEHWNAFLDVGAGNGRNCTTLLHKFKEGYAVEIDPNDALRQVAADNKNIHAIYKPIQKVTLVQKMDFVLLSDVFEHIPSKDIPMFIRSIAKLQKKGGVIYILTPNAVFCGPAEASGIYHKRHRFGHYKHYTKMELERLWQKVGYEPIFVQFEDSRTRLVLKMPMVVLSYLDKKFFSSPVLAKLTFPLVWICDKLLWVIGYISAISESIHQHDELNTRSIVMVLKKIQ